MTQKRRNFDSSFKLQVVQMITDQGLSISQVCEDLNLGQGVTPNFLKLL